MDIVLNGSCGRIQACYHKAKAADAPLAVVFAESPDLGGHMNDGTTYSLFYAFAQKGFTVLRINYRSVGNSEGVFDREDGALSDASAVLDWLLSKHEESGQLWLAGTGFGAWVGMQMLMRRVESTGFVSLAPTPKTDDFSFFNPASCDGLFIVGDVDATSSVDGSDGVRSLQNFINKQRLVRADLNIIAGADHDFRDRLKPMFQAVCDYLDKRLRAIKRTKPEAKSED